MSTTPNAKFALRNYIFTEFSFKHLGGQDEQPLNVNFNPSGKFYSTDGKFELSLLIACSNESGVECINASLTSEFHITDSDNQVPDFFYKNSIAIIFPYIRAFISTLTLQSNAGLVILPTLNLSNLEAELRAKTEIISE